MKITIKNPIFGLISTAVGQWPVLPASEFSNTLLALMPLGNSVSLSRRDIVRIAQRFNAGLRQEGKRVPEGRQKTGFRSRASAVPPGLWGAPTTRPSVETLGYCRMSLRDRILPEFPKGINSNSDSAQGTPLCR